MNTSTIVQPSVDRSWTAPPRASKFRKNWAVAVKPFVWLAPALLLLGAFTCIVNTALSSLGLGWLRHDWLGSPETAFGAVVLVDLWKWTGFHIVILILSIAPIVAVYLLLQRQFIAGLTAGAVKG